MLLLGVAILLPLLYPPALRCTAPDGGDALQGALPIPPVPFAMASAGHRRHRFVLDPGYRRLRPGAYLSCLLAEELRRRWPRLAVTVVNKGVGGETAEQMLARFTRDVLPYRPQLVIWQTGSNSVLQSKDVQGYEQTIREGITRLKAAHMDIILMDPQYAPRILGRPIHKAIVDTIGEVSNDLKVAVFQRFAVMRHWVTSGQYRMEDIISHDQLHMNDASYSCIARLLADSLASAALATPLPQTDDPMTTGSESHAGMPGALHGTIPYLKWEDDSDSFADYREDT